MTKDIIDYKSPSPNICNHSPEYKKDLLDDTRKQMKFIKYLSRGTISDCEKIRNYFKMSPTT